MMAERTSQRRTTDTQRPPFFRCLACSVFLFAAAAVQAQQGNRDYYHANESREDGQLLRNVEAYHVGPAVDRMKTHNFPSALQDIQFILDFFPNHPTGLAMLSDLCDAQWRSPQCDIDARFQAAIDRNNTAPQTFLLYGLHLQRRNQLPQAIESYKKSIALNPRSANAHYNLALAYFDQKQFDQANREAQISYALGIPLPGLRDKLTRAKVWKPIDGDELKKLMEPPAAPAAAAAAPAPAAAPVPAAPAPAPTAPVPTAPAPAPVEPAK
jgi:tetratricopeptide (TPR) repeat protein